ncbi:MAG TPA: hypothetical protein VGR35_13660 [Tepidisphaeraceae bacterium]|nr:hypothetical protein [Tepidisphaeraceae bacterium]
MSHNDPVARWLPRLRDFTPAFFQATPALSAVADDACIILHGSTTFGVDDAMSDLDVWVLVEPDCLRTVDELSPTRFFEFTLAGKCGHFNVHTRDEFAQRVARCDFPLIAELRTAIVLADPTGDAELLVRRAQLPMRDEVRHAWFAHHYIEMRSEHRACDNPIERGDAAALLLALTPAVAHALRAAMVLDGLPYPYVKWLADAASRTPTGAVIASLTNELLDLVGAGALRMAGPERQHPLNVTLRAMRQALIAAARDRGITGPWLEQWYLHLDMRQRIGDARWDAE